MNCMSKYIVTGGTGFLGRNLIKKLISDGNIVYAIVRPTSNNLNLLPDSDKVIKVFCDFGSIDTCINTLPVDCAALYHFAWRGVNREELNDEIIQHKNVSDSLKLLNTALEIGCKNFVFAGSRSEYGVQTGTYSENLDCNPIVAYGKAKLEFGRKAYDICNNTDMRFIHPRIFSVYGPDDHPWSLIYTSVQKMLKGEDIALSECKHYWNFMYVQDAIDLITTITDNSELISAEDNSIFNIATRDIRPLREFVEEIKYLTKSNSNLIYGAYSQSAESAVPLLPDMDKVERVFDWHAKVSFAEGIKSIISRMEGQDA